VAKLQSDSVRREKTLSLKLVRSVAVIDLETTGIAVDIDRIVEIGILKVTREGKRFHFRKRLNPGIKIPKEASKIHGIKNSHVADKPRFKAIARKILKFIHGCDLIGYNLKSFDLRMLQAELERAKINFSCDGRNVIDVKDIYHFHEQRTLSDAVRFYCDAKHDGAHSALNDAWATWWVLQAQVEKYGLPRSVRKLSAWIEKVRPSKFVDSGRWFSLRDGKVVFAKGKYNSVLLSQIVRDDSDYLGWILGLEDVPKDTKSLIEEMLPKTT
jgi:DNA polymerase-3 subunit epsilon